MNDELLFEWFRQNEADILRYLPYFLSRDNELKTVADACSKEHEKIRLLIRDWFYQFFVDTATWGLKYWEEFLNITSQNGDNYTTRRNRIKILLNAHDVSTIKFMTDLANKFLTDNSAKIIEHNSEYWFEVFFNIDGLISLEDLRAAIELYKPAHLGFKIVFYILSKILTSHKASITQYVNANHNFWNLGTAEKTYWDGVWCWDGSIDWSGIKPDAKYKERQSHIAQILTKVNSAYIFNTGQSADITYKITSKHSLLTSHKAGSIYYVDIDLKQNIENRALNTGKINAMQNRTTGNAKNLWDGSFCWDGSHAWQGDYTLQNTQMENLCTFFSTDKNGNMKKGSFERL
ncbi:putative phage tail protein [uncultured Megamonas sp.]|uniref:putative phage tail protein n=2 Tax=Megamonas TaxID=158846 RepID=UPI00259A5C88|nr:putative phage tail protein [uncultured Megamonas sp.]